MALRTDFLDQDIFSEVGAAADELGIACYVVGGFEVFLIPGTSTSPRGTSIRCSPVLFDRQKYRLLTRSA